MSCFCVIQQHKGLDSVLFFATGRLGDNKTKQAYKIINIIFILYQIIYIRTYSLVILMKQLRHSKKIVIPYFREIHLITTIQAEPSNFKARVVFHHPPTDRST